MKPIRSLVRVRLSHRFGVVKENMASIFPYKNGWTSSPFFFGVNAFLISILLVMPRAVVAEIQQSNFCPISEPLAPNGVVVRMQESYFRTCRIWNDDNSWRQFLLKVNAEFFQDLSEDHAIDTIRVIENVKEIDRLSNAIRSMPRRGVRVFGGLEYDSYESKFIGPNGRPNAGTYVFREDQVKTTEVPSHWVTCFGWSFLEQGRALNCSVNVDTGPVVGSVVFIGIGKYKGNNDFINHFGVHARDIARVLEVADITENLESMKDLVEIVD